MKITLSMLFVVFAVFSVVEIQADYVIPNAQIEILKPKGIRVTIPGSPGIQYFAFHANINKAIKEGDEGDIYFGASAPYNGNWMSYDEDTEVKEGDVLHYWISVFNKNKDYKKSDLSYKVQ